MDRGGIVNCILRLRPRVIAQVAAALIVGAAPAGAPPAATLDQSNLGAIDGGTGMNIDNSSNRFIAQTFTVGIGGLLTAVDFGINRLETTTGDVLLWIYATDGVIPIATNYGHVTIPDAAISTVAAFPGNGVLVTGIDVSSLNVIVSPGEVLAIAVSPTDYTNPVFPAPGGSFPIGFTRAGDPDTALCGDPGGYPGGCVWGSEFGLSWDPFNKIFDIRFNIYVDAVAVPQPGGLGLIIAGLLVIGLALPVINRARGHG